MEICYLTRFKIYVYYLILTGNHVILNTEHRKAGSDLPDYVYRR